MQYTLLDFKKDQDLFNDITGASQELTKADLLKQANIIAEEIDEMFEGIENGDLVEVVDGAIDSLYTVLGMLQKLKNMGINIEASMYKVAKDNLAKFPKEMKVALATKDYYSATGVQTTISGDIVNEVYVIRDENGKVRKPVGFIPTDLTPFVNADLIEDFKNV